MVLPLHSCMKCIIMNLNISIRHHWITIVMKLIYLPFIMNKVLLTFSMKFIVERCPSDPVSLWWSPEDLPSTNQSCALRKCLSACTLPRYDGRVTQKQVIRSPNTVTVWVVVRRGIYTNIILLLHRIHPSHERGRLRHACNWALSGSQSNTNSQWHIEIFRPLELVWTLVFE